MLEQYVEGGFWRSMLEEDVGWRSLEEDVGWRMLEKDVGGGYWLKECVEVNVGWRMRDSIESFSGSRDSTCASSGYRADP